MLKVKNLSLSLTSSAIFSNVSFEAQEGSITHIDGKNGSGKTSLLKCITGIYETFKGEITIADYRVSRLTIRDYSPLLSFFIDKGFSYPFLSVSQNLDAFKYYSNISTLNPRLLELMDEFGLSDLKDEKVSRLSAGFRQKLEIVIALLNDGIYVLLDEPTVNLDKDSIELLYHYISKTAGLERKTYLVVSHNDTKLSSLANQTLTLR